MAELRPRSSSCLPDTGSVRVAVEHWCSVGVRGRVMVQRLTTARRINIAIWTRSMGLTRVQIEQNAMSMCCSLEHGWGHVNMIPRPWLPI